MNICDILLGEDGEEFIESIGSNSCNILSITDAIYLKWKGVSEKWIEKLHYGEDYLRYITGNMVSADIIRYLKVDSRLIPIHEKLVDIGNMLHGNYDLITSLNNIISYMTKNLEEPFGNLIKNRPELVKSRIYANYHYPIFVRTYAKYVEGYLTAETIPDLISQKINTAQKLHTRLYELGYDTLTCPKLDLISIDDVLYYLKVCPDRIKDISSKFNIESAINSDNAEILEAYYKNGIITEQDIILLQISHLRHHIKRSLHITYNYRKTKSFAMPYDTIIVKEEDGYLLGELINFRNVRYVVTNCNKLIETLSRYPNITLDNTIHLHNIYLYIDEFYKNVTLYKRIFNHVSFTNLIEIANYNPSVLKYHLDLSIISKYYNITTYAKKLNCSNTSFSDCIIKLNDN